MIQPSEFTCSLGTSLAMIAYAGMSLVAAAKAIRLHNMYKYYNFNCYLDQGFYYLEVVHSHFMVQARAVFLPRDIDMGAVYHLRDSYIDGRLCRSIKD